MLRRLSLLLSAMVLSSTALAAQQPESVVDPDAPEPYAPDEFGLALQALRRGEIITVGVFPLALLVTRVAYQYGRWAFDEFDPQSAPYAQPLGSDPFPDEADRIAVVVGAVGVSVVFAFVDYLIGLARQQQTARETLPASAAEGG